MSNYVFSAQQEAWLQALESGNYEQTTGSLCVRKNEKSSYCCLGVACEIYREDTGHLNLSETPQFDGFCRVLYENKLTEPPTIVEEFFSLNKKGISELMRLNDYIGLTFRQIAARIREKPEFFFNEHV